MHIPWFSTFTLFTEILVTVSVLYIFYKSYKSGLFPKKLVAATLAYEIIFNITYMASSAISHSKQQVVSRFYVILAIFHGSFSLLMFLLLVLFMSLAWRKYSQGSNFFREHKKLTLAFTAAWLVAVTTGFVFYYGLYLH